MYYAQETASQLAKELRKLQESEQGKNKHATKVQREYH